MPHDLTDDKSTSVQIMAWCRQATSHYLNQCWPRSPTPYGITRPQWVNSLAPGKCGRVFECIIFKFIIQNSRLGTHCETALRWMPLNFTNEKSTLFQLMAFMPSGNKPLSEPMLIHYLGKCWPRSMSQYSILRQWVNFDTFTRTPVHVSKMNSVACAQLTS